MKIYQLIAIFLLSCGSLYGQERKDSTTKIYDEVMLYVHVEPFFADVLLDGKPIENRTWVKVSKGKHYIAAKARYRYNLYDTVQLKGNKPGESFGYKMELRPEAIGYGAQFTTGFIPLGLAVSTSTRQYITLSNQRDAINETVSLINDNPDGAQYIPRYDQQVHKFKTDKDIYFFSNTALVVASAYLLTVAHKRRKLRQSDGIDKPTASLFITPYYNYNLCLYGTSFFISF